jgi:hypothetical protein
VKNTGGDRQDIEATRLAITQLLTGMRRRVLVRADAGGGRTLDVCGHD